MGGSDLSKSFGLSTGGRGLHTPRNYTVFHRFWVFYQCLVSSYIIIDRYSYVTRLGWVFSKFFTHVFHPLRHQAWLDGAEVSASGWRSGGPRFQSHPRLTFQSCSRYQLNQLGSKAASESTFKKSNTCGVSNNRLYFTFTLRARLLQHCCSGLGSSDTHFYGL